jgi:Heat shock protein
VPLKKVLVFTLLFIVLAGCAALNTQDPANVDNSAQTIQGKTWQWYKTVTSVETVTVKQPERYALLLTADGRAQVQFDCNRGGGSYNIAGNALSFGPMMSTKMACLGDSLDHLFASTLQKVHAFWLDDASGELKLMFDGGDMYFRAKP